MLIHQLSIDECEDFLARSSVGRLACARNQQPYVVPISFYYATADRCLYSFATVGRKIEWMRLNPKVCIEVDEIRDRFDWTTAVVTGRYDELTNAPQRSTELHRARELLQSRKSWWLPGTAKLDDGTEHHAAVFYRVVVESITGRRAEGKK